MRGRFWRPFYFVAGVIAVALMAVAVPTPSSAADSEIVVRARGRLGTENIDLLVNGSAVASWELTGPWFENFVYKVPAGVEVETLRVRHDSGSWPKAVIVDWVELDGRNFDSSSYGTISRGSWDAATGCAEGVKRSDWLTCDNSWFDYAVSSSNSQILAVKARGRLGTEDVDLMINGTEVLSWQLGTDFRTYYHRIPRNVDQLRLRNNSGGWPSAVNVDYVTVGGLKYDSSDWRTLSSGSWDATDGCGQGVKRSDWLTCDNSWFDYGYIENGVPKYRVIRVKARGRMGDETLELLVDGRVVETWNLATEFDTHFHLYSPNEQFSSIRVRSTGGGWPSAAIVDYLDLGRYEIDTSDGRTLSSGSWDSVGGCGEGIKRSDWLTCSNAWFEYDLRSARDPVD